MMMFDVDCSIHMLMLQVYVEMFLMSWFSVNRVYVLTLLVDVDVLPMMSCISVQVLMLLVDVDVDALWCPVGQCPSVSALPTVSQSSVAAAFSQTLSYWPLHHMWSVRPSHRPLSHTSQQLSQVERESFLQSRNIEIQRDGGESI